MPDEDGRFLSRRLGWDAEDEQRVEAWTDPAPTARYEELWDDELAPAEAGPPPGEARSSPVAPVRPSFERRDLDRMDEEALDRRRQLWRDTAVILIGVIAALTLGVLSLTQQVNQPMVAVLCFVLAGGLLGFLRWNFHPAVIFQGTAGVMFLGYTLAVLAILGSAKVVVALLVLAVPIIDTFWVIVRRLSARRSPFSPDRGHIHHRLLDLGLSHRSTVLLIYAICGTLGLMSLFVNSATGIIAFVGALVILGVVAFVLRRGPTEAHS